MRTLNTGAVIWFGGLAIPIGITVALATPALASWRSWGPITGIAIASVGLGLLVAIAFTSPINVVPDTTRTDSAVRALRKDIVSAAGDFTDNFDVNWRGPSLLRGLEILHDHVAERERMSEIVIEEAENRAVQEAARQFFRGWRTLVDEFAEASDKEAEMKRLGGYTQRIRTTALWEQAVQGKFDFLRAVDGYVNAGATPKG
jgi:hypothetical protein